MLMDCEIEQKRTVLKSSKPESIQDNDDDAIDDGFGPTFRVIRIRVIRAQIGVRAWRSKARRLRNVGASTVERKLCSSKKKPTSK